MTIAIAGISDLSGRRDQSAREGLVRKALSAQNFGGIEHDISIMHFDRITLGRIVCYPETQDLPLQMPVAENDRHALVGTFRIYEPSALGLDLISSEVTSEDSLSLKVEHKLVNDGLALEALKTSNGDFACAMVDKNSGALHLMNDHLGLTSLLYAHQPNDFVTFASFPTGLMAMNLLPLKRKSDAMVRTLVAATSSFSYIEGIEELRGGKVLSFDGNKKSENCFWSLRDIPEDGSLAFEDAARKLNELISSATTKRMSRFATTASHLSSGLDSGSIAVVAARQAESLGQRVVGLTISDGIYIPGLKPRDETNAVRNLVQQEGGIDMITEDIPKGAVLFENETAIEGTDIKGYRDKPNTMLTIAGLNRGCDVVLSGLGGDEFASHRGQKALTSYIHRFQFRKVLGQLRDFHSARNWKPLKYLARTIFMSYSPNWVWKLPFNTLPSSRGLHNHYKGAVSKENLTKLVKLHQDRFATRDGRSYRELEFKNANIQKITLDYGFDAMQLGVRYTYPLLDRRIVEFCHGLPDEYYVRNGHYRALMRAATSNLLPEDIRLQATKMAPIVGSMSRFSNDKEKMIGRTQELIEKHGDWLHDVHLPTLLEEFQKIPDAEKALELDNSGELLPRLIAMGDLLSYVETALINDAQERVER